MQAREELRERESDFRGIVDFTAKTRGPFLSKLNSPQEVDLLI